MLSLFCFFLCVVVGITATTTRALIITIGHSGSKTLVKVLNTHSQIHMEGELLFHPRYKVSFKLATQHTEEILAQPEEKSVHGFKILYHQIWLHPVSFFFWLRSNHSDVKIIHLIRRNYFEHYLSFYEGKPTTMKHHTTKDVLDHISDTALRTHSMTHLIQEHTGPTLTVLYEDLVQDPKRQLHAIQQFLGVSYESLSFESKNKLNERLPWERVPDWPIVCQQIQERQELDSNLEDCLERWSVARWESEVKSVGNVCLLR